MANLVLKARRPGRPEASVLYCEPRHDGLVSPEQRAHLEVNHSWRTFLVRCQEELWKTPNSDFDNCNAELPSEALREAIAERALRLPALQRFEYAPGDVAR